VAPRRGGRPLLCAILRGFGRLHSLAGRGLLVARAYTNLDLWSRLCLGCGLGRSLGGNRFRLGGSEIIGGRRFNSFDGGRFSAEGFSRRSSFSVASNTNEAFFFGAGLDGFLDLLRQLDLDGICTGIHGILDNIFIVFTIFNDLA
jgi:hypothetical protein